METVASASTADHGKWISAHNFIRAYNKLANQFNQLQMSSEVPVYDESSLGSPHSVTWIEQKNRFDMILADALALEATLSVVAPVASTHALPIEDLIQSHLRKIIFDKPNKEVEVQNALDALLVGRGYSRGGDYIREGEKLYFSGKEFIPDFSFPKLGIALEVKMIKERSGVSSAIEQMSADVPAYKSKYERLLFVVYDLGYIQDILEFGRGLETDPSVRVLVVKQ